MGNAAENCKQMWESKTFPNNHTHAYNNDTKKDTILMT
jgi:hypothetical protein